MPKCADTDKQKISQYRWLPISEPIIGATLAIITCILKLDPQKHCVGTTKTLCRYCIIIISHVQARVLCDVISRSHNKLIDTFREYLTLFKGI